MLLGFTESQALGYKIWYQKMNNNFRFSINICVLISVKTDLLNPLKLSFDNISIFIYSHMNSFNLILGNTPG